MTLSNPNGVFSYGTTAGFGGAFTLFTDHSSIGGLSSWNLPPAGGDVPAVYQNNTGSAITALSATYAPGSLGFHPGDGNVTAVYRFTAPTTETYSYTSSFFAQDTNTSSQVGVFVNNVQFGSLGVVNSSLTQNKYGSGFLLTAGSTIDFVVGNNGDKTFDSTGLTFSVTAVPEPETAALMLAGLAAVGFVAKRRKS